MFFPFEEINKAHMIVHELEVEDDDPEDTQVSLSDLSDPMLAALASYGITITDTGVNVDNKDAFAKAQALFTSVVEAYDSDDFTGLWDKLELQGDDDVDYNGGIPSMVFETIEHMWNKEGGLHV
jgi:hypothetical protein